MTPDLITELAGVQDLFSTPAVLTPVVKAASSVCLTTVLLVLRFFAALLMFHSLRSYLGISGTVVVATTLALSIASRSGVIVSSLTGDDKVISSMTVLALGVKEICLGLVYAAPLALALEALVGAARIVDVSRGVQTAEQYYPALGSHASPLEGFAVFAVGGVFLLSGGGELMYATLGKIPVGATGEVGPLASLNWEAYMVGVLHEAGLVLESSLLIAAPVVLAALAVDIVGAYLSRLLPRVQFVLELLPLKLCAGLIALLATGPMMGDLPGPLLKTSIGLALSIAG